MGQRQGQGRAKLLYESWVEKNNLLFKEEDTTVAAVMVQWGQPQQCHVWSVYPLPSYQQKKKLFSQVVQLKPANKFPFLHYLTEAKGILQAACFGKLLALGLEEHN